ncbi:MAG TPA: gliding motility-associated C-terminal domain-containing protein, partial [Bacteroidales bacterium]|nr:gliding motility-associated C-terminal domain-containing protein [Bacteroidales bacterium]
GYEYSIGGAYQSGSTFTGVAPGARSVTVRSSSDNTCVSSATVVTVNASPWSPSVPIVGTITQPSCNMTTGSVVLNGLPAGNWTVYPGAITGNTTSTTISGLAAGTYNFTVTNASGCNSVPSDDVVINTLPAAPLAPTVGIINQPTCSLPTGSVILRDLPAGNWIINPGAKAGNGTSITLPGLAEGTYNFTVTDESGCASTESADIVIIAPPLVPAAAKVSFTQPTCTSATGSITVTEPLGAFEYSIDGGVYQSSVTFNSVVAGSHTINTRTISDNVCVSEPKTFIINAQPATPSSPVIKKITQPTCAIMTGSVELDGLPSENWIINPGAKSGNTTNTTISGLTPGTYAFTVTNTEGCISLASEGVVINNLPSAPSVSINSQINVSCNGGNNGSISVSGTGGLPPYLFKLESGPYQASGVFNSMTPGTYTITIQDSNSCTSSLQSTIVEPVELKVTYISEDATCLDVANGKVTLDIEGGTAPYDILWADGNNSFERSDLLASSYRVLIKDANGCVSSIDAEVGLSGLSSCLEIQEIITPNNDGYYDTWKIKNIDMFPNAEVEVFNRWGKRVFSTKNLSANEWDGRMNGKLLPTDSYHYILILNDGSKPIRGVVTIVR